MSEHDHAPNAERPPRPKQIVCTRASEIEAARGTDVSYRPAPSRAAGGIAPSAFDEALTELRARSVADPMGHQRRNGDRFSLVSASCRDRWNSAFDNSPSVAILKNVWQRLHRFPFPRPSNP